VVARVVKRRARAVMILGTASSVGKSLIVTALCRHLARGGVRVAPFKAQNMSLNSAATPDGLEIGRAQALQAEAAGLAASADMNPVLIKPECDTGAQLIVQGRIAGRLEAHEFGGRSRERLWPYVRESYARLAEAYDVIVIEGAGSPAEFNLRDGDIVNMAMAHEAGARCVLIGDIDRGGVFAALLGTMALLEENDRERIDAFAINKFRGDRMLLDPAIAAFERRIQLPSLGVIPHLGDIGLEEEDGVWLESRRLGRARHWLPRRSDDRLRVAVIALPHIANFTDFDALAEEPCVDLCYTDSGTDVAMADLVIVPGTKETLGDLHWLRRRSLDSAIAQAAQTRIVFGICGGLQMLGERIDDPHAVESGGSVEGLGLLPLRTTFARTKITVPVRGRVTATRAGETTHESGIFDGYEIHVGETQYGDVMPFALLQRNGERIERRDGAISHDRRVFATYVHGLFAGDAFRHRFIDAVRASAGLPRAAEYAFVERERAARLDRVAAGVANALDLQRVFPELRSLAASRPSPSTDAIEA
jgi:adenosylcobyric acid synthase